MTDDGTGWQRVGSLDPRELGEARLQLHHVVQVVQSYARSLLLPRDDDSQASLGWSPTHRALVSHAVEDKAAALEPAARELLFLVHDAVTDRFALTDATVDDAVEWLRSHMGRNVSCHTLDTPYGIPRHALERGAAFTAEAHACAELARWFGNAHLVLSRIAATNADATAVRCWPHHFDIATLLVVAGSGDDTRTIGCGLSPGDESYDEPYVYVTPWPHPADDELGEPPAGGHWHVDGYTAAVLTGRGIVQAGDAAAQERAVGTFLREAVEIGRRFVASASGS